MRIRGFWAVADVVVGIVIIIFLCCFLLVGYVFSVTVVVLLSWSSFFSCFVWLVVALHGGWEWGDRRLVLVHWLGFRMGWVIDHNIEQEKNCLEGVITCLRQFYGLRLPCQLDLPGCLMASYCPTGYKVS